MADASGRPAVHIWQNGMCITYLTKLKKIHDFFTANGCRMVDDPAQADLILVGACASFLPWFDLYAEKMDQLAALGKRLAVYGCLPTVNRDFFEKHTPPRELVARTRHPELVEQLLDNPEVPWADIPEPSDFRPEDFVDYKPGRRFVIIQYGCSETCVYCPHRVGMGPQKSRPYDEVEAHVRRVVDEGARIVFLEGSNSGSWGLDLEPPATYPDLVRGLLALPGYFEVHLGNLACKWVVRYGDQLMHERITCIKSPIQTSSPRLLALMRRDDTVPQAGPVYKRLKAANPGLVLRTEIIAGLPTEAEEEFMATLDYVAEHFDEVSCFSYDYHPYTKLARMGLPFHDEETIAARINTAKEYFAARPHVRATFEGGQVCDKLLHEDEDGGQDL